MGLIYLASNLITDKNYVGQTTGTLEKRKAKHLQNAFSRDLDNKFYQAIRKHGIDSFEWEILEEIEDRDLDEREIYWIKEFNTLFEGYNMTEGGGALRGYKHSDKTKKKQSHANKGISMKDRYLNLYGEEDGIKKYEEYIKKLNKSNGKGKTRLELFIERHGEEEGRKKYDAFIKRIKETRKKKLSKEHKEKISRGCKGLKQSEEFKKNLSKIKKEYWKQKKASKF